jgi:hypothetical protein
MVERGGADLAVTTLEGLLCVLFYDVERAGWFLERVYD